MMKKLFTILIAFICFVSVSLAQDDLLNMMEKETPKIASPVFATFKSTRVINLQSNETMKKKHLDFRIQHRFDVVDLSKNNAFGFYNLFGLDIAKMRLSLDYGITDWLMVGIGRTPWNITYDGNVKAKLLVQKTKGKGTMPIGLNYFGAVGISTISWPEASRDNFLTSRMAFVHQLIIVRKFNEWVSLELVPTFIHHNLVPYTETPNDVYALGIGASIKITRSTRFNIEYIPRFNGRNTPINLNDDVAYDEFGVGFDIETGGHVFQLHLTNAMGLIEQQFITENTNKLSLTTLHLGFNISRTFSFDNSEKKKK